MKFRKKPVVIEATQWFKEGDHPYVKLRKGSTANNCSAYIPTLKGPMEVTAGDWIITGVRGEHYPCKPDIFEMTYERVEGCVAAAEREACAKVAEEPYEFTSEESHRIAASIRARGNT